jgi:hypothetical protein
MRAFSSFSLVPAFLEFGIFFLQVCRVKKHDWGDFCSSRLTIDTAMKAFPDQLGQQTTVVEMGMGQQNSIKAPG